MLCAMLRALLYATQSKKERRKGAHQRFFESLSWPPVPFSPPSCSCVPRWGLQHYPTPAWTLTSASATATESCMRSPSDADVVVEKFMCPCRSASRPAHNKYWS